MARPLRIHAPGVLCHVVARGNNKQAIFRDHRDYERYIDLLAAACSRFSADCVGFCLMENHVHLLLRANAYPLSRLMQQLNSTYCRWWNYRHGRVGHVLQGRYKQRLVDDEIYKRRVIRYVIRNPIVGRCVDSLDQWQWSSYRACAGLDLAPRFLDCEDVWSMFPRSNGASPQQQFERFVQSDTDDALMIPFIAGPPAFAAEMQPALQRHLDNSDYVYAERFAARPSLSELCDGISPIEAAASRAFLEWGYTLAEVGRHLDRSPTTVWAWIRRGVRSRSSIFFARSRSDPA